MEATTKRVSPSFSFEKILSTFCPSELSKSSRIFIQSTGGSMATKLPQVSAELRSIMPPPDKQREDYNKSIPPRTIKHRSPHTERTGEEEIIKQTHKQEKNIEQTCRALRVQHNSELSEHNEKKKRE
ncbi:hypothetical protein AVEN_53420-1 [Araneus ventricosus]|uniref:Uncharacterized protein n=1 Tax=Araneus ventricosus TaxID=182803 RepID=A0A4Y2AAA9_ARAVE|nr:hypothetical protein AVEN_53420-1 [Araneus ventricosus]